MRIIIGSQAMRFWFPDSREPKDFDLVTDEIETPMKEDGWELLPNKPLCDWLRLNPNECINGYASPNVLYTLKVSHLFWDNQWSKHIWDVHFLNSKGCHVIWNLFDILHNHWMTNSPIWRSNLAMTAENFFDNAVNFKYDHDEIHEGLTPTPAYKKILVGNETVETSDYKFFNKLTHQERLDVVTEETMVMAYERQFGRSWQVAYTWMLKKLIMVHLPIKQAVWAMEHFRELQRPKFNYVNQLNTYFNGKESRPTADNYL